MHKLSVRTHVGVRIHSCMLSTERVKVREQLSVVSSPFLLIETRSIYIFFLPYCIPECLTVDLCLILL